MKFSFDSDALKFRSAASDPVQRSPAVKTPRPLCLSGHLDPLRVHQVTCGLSERCFGDLRLFLCGILCHVLLLYMCFTEPSLERTPLFLVLFSKGTVCMFIPQSKKGGSRP